jgi:lantibiotic biosynthesis protein
MQRKADMHFTDELVLRIPALSFSSLQKEEDIKGLLYNLHFMEAVQLASPVLYRECMKWKGGLLADEKEVKKITASLAKYYQRMLSRCTPFGLFSGCTVVKWKEEGTAIEISPEKFRRSTRLDMHYLCALALQLSSLPAIRKRLQFFPNNSRYHTGNGLRYMEYNYEKGARMYKISSVDASDWLDQIFTKAKHGATIDDVTTLLVADGVAHEDAVEFTHELINNQLLISELDPKITGEEYMHQVLQTLKKINNPADGEITAITGLLEAIVNDLRNCDEAGLGNEKLYSSLIEKIKQTGVAFDEGRLLQTDRFPMTGTAGISKEIQEKLLSVVNTLLPLSAVATDTHLSSFTEKFRNRYEDKEVPLLQALDTETGIGYTQQSGKNLSPLIDALALPAGERNSYDIKWNKKEQWLFDLLLRSQNEYEVELPVDTIPENTSIAPLPPSLSVMFSLTESGIVFRGASGSSAVNILGRFGYGDEGINQLCKKVAEEEQTKNPAVVFAEIIHLPEDRVGNILQHPPFRKYEIPFLATSSAEQQYQIPLQDIMVTVRENKVRLRSLSLNKSIMPRLSNAHNFSFRSLPVYQFLADVQSQGSTHAVMFSWGAMGRSFTFLPRVKMKDIILSEATWQLGKADFSTLVSDSSTSAVKAFTEKWKMPAMVVLADGDNELLVDWESPVSISAFVSVVRNREQIIIKEFLLPDAKAVTTEDGKPYCNQFVAALINENEVLPVAMQSSLIKKEKIQGGFLPGTEWVYYKIYCGSKSADDILAHIIHPLVNLLKEKQLIDKWFFIRYVDPDFHIRIRFHLQDTGNYGAVAAACAESFQPALDKGMLWKVQADTYFRELERYGDATIAVVEDLFYYDSELKLKFLQLTEGDERETLRWQWGMRGVDELLDMMGYTLEQKYSLMQFFRDSFAAEFGADKNLFKQLNTKYNDNRAMVQAAMENPVSASNVLKPLLGLYREGHNELKKIIDRLRRAAGPGSEREMEGWTGSYIHMNLNRLFLSEPRLHELVLYDFLCSWYRSCISRKGKEDR